MMFSQRSPRNFKPPIQGKQFGAWIVLILVLSTVVGCEEAKVPVVPVRGTLKVGNEIPEGAEVVLHPIGHTLPNGAAPLGRVDKDGSFQLSIYSPGEGVPEGQYVATVQWYKVSKDAKGEQIAVNVVPKEYRSPKSSPLKISVVAGNPELDPIVIPRG